MLFRVNNIMNGFLEVLLLFGVGIITGFINVMAGGGSTITLPVLIFLGLDSSVANGTNRIGLLSQNLFGILSFKKENVSQIKLSAKLSLFTLPGAIIGAFYATKIDDHFVSENFRHCYDWHCIYNANSKLKALY